MAHPTASATHSDSAAPHAGGHFMPLWKLGATLAALLVLTAVTVEVTRTAWLDFGRAGNLWIAMIIATLKATLVALYFMHVRYEKPIIGIILVVSLLFVLLFVVLALLDSTQYQSAITEWRAEDPTRYAPALDQP